MKLSINILKEPAEFVAERKVKEEELEKFYVLLER